MRSPWWCSSADDFLYTSSVFVRIILTLPRSTCLPKLKKKVLLCVFSLFSDPVFYYTACVAASRLHLKRWCEPFAGEWRLNLISNLLVHVQYFKKYHKSTRHKVCIFYYGFLVGLLAVLLDLPFDIMGVKLLWWTWHDTDPNIFDRSFHVPWTSYYFHASFAASLCFLFQSSRAAISSVEKFASAG